MSRLRLNADIIVFLVIPFALLPTVVLSTSSSYADGSFYQSSLALRKLLLSPDNYSSEIPPVANVGDIVNVTGRFSLIEIVILDDVREEIVTSVFFQFTWKDQIRSWNSSDFGGISFLEMDAKNVWRPSLQIMNAVDSRDPFRDQDSYLELSSDGETAWHPSGILHTGCNLRMFHYPFDTQTCEQLICPTYNNGTTLQLNLDENIDMTFYETNSNWEIIRSKVVNEKRTVSDSNTFSCIKIHLKMRRVNVSIAFVLLIPLVCLPFLNTYVFKMPLETGENMSYAITVVLAVMVSQATMNAMLPQVSDINPFFTFYATVNVLISMCTVPSVIWIGHLHHKYEVNGGEVHLDGSRSKLLKPFDVRVISFLIKVTRWETSNSNNSKPTATKSGDTEMSDCAVRVEDDGGTRRRESGKKKEEGEEREEEGEEREEEGEEREEEGNDEEVKGNDNAAIEGENFLKQAIRTSCYEGLSMNINKTLFRFFYGLCILVTVIFLSWFMALSFMSFV